MFVLSSVCCFLNFRVAGEVSECFHMRLASVGHVCPPTGVAFVDCLQNPCGAFGNLRAFHQK